MADIPLTENGVRTRRRRRSPEQAREEALTSARGLLMQHGPPGVTLKAVADDIGMSHGNLIHHFGSAEGLQSALMAAMVQDLTIALEGAVAQVRADDAAPRQLVDIVFDAFSKGGAGQLAAWIGMSHEYRQLEPVRAAVQALAQAVDEKAQENDGEPPRHIASAVLFITLCAFGDAVIGPPLRQMLGRDPDSVRRLSTHLLPSFF